MPITVDGSSPAGVSNLFFTATSASFNPPGGVLLVACVSTSTANSSNTLSVTNNGTALTWTQLVFINSVVGKKGACGIYYAVLSTARTGMTISGTMGGSGSGVVLKPYVLNGVDLASPAGNTASGSNNLTSFSTTSFSAARAGSIGFVVSEDNNGGTMSSSDTTNVVSVDSGGNGRNAVIGYKTLGAASSSSTFAVATTGAPANNWVSGEFKAAPRAAGGDWLPFFGAMHNDDELAARRLERRKSGLYVPRARELCRAA